MGITRAVIAAAAVTAATGAAAAFAARRHREGSGPVVRGHGDPEPDAAGLLACPNCHGALTWAGSAAAWQCPTCARSFPVSDGIVHVVEPQELGPLDRRFAHLYDWFSWFYPAFTRAGFALIGMTEGRGRRQVLDRLDPRGGRVLEVSIGPGSNLRYLLARPDVGEVHGVDISIGQLRRCRALVRRRGWQVPLYLASAEALPFQDATFDAVLHIGGINFFDDKSRALAEMARVAKPGTRIVVVDENERAARSYERTLPGFRSTFPQARPAVTAPVAEVPDGMRNVTVSDLWRGWFYCLEFVTPDGASTTVRPAGAPAADRQHTAVPLRGPSHEFSQRTRSVVLMLLAPVFLVALPALLIGLGARLDEQLRLAPAPRPPANLVVGIPLILAGGTLGLWSNYRLFTAGRGTPLPLMPTQELIVVPPYTYSRNPMALGAVGGYLGVATLFRSLGAVVVVLLCATGLLAYIRFGEEPVLIERFGPDDLAYRRRTPFLLPRAVGLSPLR